MDHFIISQTCSFCLRGMKMFRVDLSLYEDDGRLKVGVENMDMFKFTCNFCWENSKLDFYRFSHPDLIRHLKRVHEHCNKMKRLFNEINILLNNNSDFLI